MAAYRQVHITFWQDPFIEELTPKQKYFYIYLMTNSKTRQCGCYEISMKLIKYETGLTQSEIDSYIKLLVQAKKIDYDKLNKEFLVINWLKHNSFKSPKVKTCISKELELIKTKRFKDFVNGIINSNTSIDSLSIVYGESSGTGSQKEEEQEGEQEEELNKKEKFLEFVFLTDDEHMKLVQTYGPSKVDDMIQNLNNYIGSKGKKYKSHYHTLLAWERKNGTATSFTEEFVESAESGAIAEAERILRERGEI